MLERKIVAMDVDPIQSVLWQTFWTVAKAGQISEGLLKSETGILDQEIDNYPPDRFRPLSARPIGDQNIRLPIDRLETIVPSKGCL
jgi:hypothetical protein